MNGLIAILAQEESEGGSLLGVLLLLLPFAALIYLMFIPQRRQRQKHEKFVSTLSVGDEVVTAGGIYGRISFIDESENMVHLEVDTDVVVRLALSSISGPAVDDVAEAGNDDDDGDGDAGDD